MIYVPTQETRLAPPSRKITSACVRHNSRACEPRLLKSESLGSATRSLCTTKNRRPSPQLEKNPSSDKDPEQPKQIKLIKKEKENSPAPTILAPQVCSPSSHQARAGGRSRGSLPCLLPSEGKSPGCAFCTDTISHQLRRLNKALSGSRLSLQRCGECPRTGPLRSQALRKPPSQALPTTVWGLLPSRPSMTHVPAKPQDKPGPSCHWRARQEHCAGVLTPSPLKTPPLTSKTQGPRSFSTPETARPLFLAALALLLHSVSVKAFSVSGDTKHSHVCLQSDLSPPLQTASSHVAPGGSLEFHKSSGSDPNSPYFNNLHCPPSRPGAETSGR